MAAFGGERKLNDYLALAGNPSVRKLLDKFGSGEVVHFSDFVVKINPRERPQERVLLITNKAVYNLLPTDYGKCKRRMPFEILDYVTASAISDEFVLHCPTEYDYRLMSLRKSEVLATLEKNYQECTGFQLIRETSQQIVLKAYCVTKAQAKKVKREPRQKRLVKKVAAPAPAAAARAAPAASTKTTANYSGWGGDTKVGPDDFDLVKVIGRGSFGKVMLVRKKGARDRKTYAMKVLRKEAIVQRNQVEHTRAEGEILRSIDHPFLMRLHHAFQTVTKLYFIMDYLVGGELFFHLKNERRFNERRARLYTAEIALGLGHLHEKNIIYRDLKPENILLDREGHLRLTDFGLSKRYEPGKQAQTFCGTPEYLAPEVVMGVGHSKEVDWWSLGILLYEMLVGLPPFYSENVNVMYELIQKAQLRIPSFVSADARTLLVKLLKRDPRERCGYGPEDVKQIQTHPFFKSFDWVKCYNRQIQPSFVPKVRGDADTSQFDEEFTSEPVVDSVVQSSQMARAANFTGFTYNEKTALG